mmetsp:Transcript_24130/g.78611  ORF Transcript_24130/g.78611 Transcript_24130/m.78611 type:complete len:191 (-) Transcript_24130:127-699(-)
MRRSSPPCRRPLATANGILPTKLYSTNRNVDDENAAELAKLPSAAPPHEQPSYDAGDPKAVAELDRRTPVPSLLRTKVGAQVVLLRNLSERRVNGSRGVVTGFKEVTHAELAGGAKKVHASLLPGLLATFERVPLVRFSGSEAPEPVFPCAFSANAGPGLFADRVQIPLKLAWEETHDTSHWWLRSVGAL